MAHVVTHSGVEEQHLRIRELMLEGRASRVYADESNRDEIGRNPSDDVVILSKERRMNMYFRSIEAYSAALGLAKSTGDLMLRAKISMELGRTNGALSELADKCGCTELAVLSNTAAIEAHSDGLAIASKLGDKRLAAEFRQLMDYERGIGERIQWMSSPVHTDAILEMQRDHTLGIRRRILRRARRREFVA